MNNMSNDYLLISYTKLVDFCKRLFCSYGFSAKESVSITEVLLRADLYGIESHGVQRLVRYHEEIGSGVVDVYGKTEIVGETPVSTVIDAHKVMGQLAGIEGMNLAMKKASVTGIGMVTVRNSNHYGIAAYYTALAVQEDMIGICMTNTEAICVPTNGKQAMLGTNPIAFAMPADPIPFSFDAATTVVPRGTLEVYDKNGKSLPAGWAVDTVGLSTQDTGAVLDAIIGKKGGGGIAPLGGIGELSGGHKGYGLATMVDICTGILSGGLTSNHINVKPGETGICHYFAAIDYGMFGDKKELRARLSTFLRELRDSPKADGAERIYTHGEKEAETTAVRMNGLIPMNGKTLQEVQNIAALQGVVFDLL
ncbi:MAG: Ldh family oxidoreductase [Treponema sp.]|jgi:LDH2 family malate/lactate/ureidoglycolate dehydrogenase|nr:Ldh family oxidoreductase [Treponema sp.]